MADPQEQTPPTVERIAGGADADERVLDHLAALGCAPETPLAVSHFLYVPEHAGADAVSQALDRDGWSTTLEACDDTSWLVVAAQTRTLTRDIVRDTRRTLEALAAEHGGIYDGWEARAA